MNATYREWPALYQPKVELTNIAYNDPRQPTGYYLHDPEDIFAYTLYWTFIFHLPPFVASGIYAFLNLSVPPTRRLRRRESLVRRSYDDDGDGGDQRPHHPHVLHKRHQPVEEAHPMLALSSPGSATATPSPSRPRTPFGSATPPPPKPKPNWRRSRAAFALIVLAVYFASSLAGAVIGAAITAYVLAGLFDAANYNMSTWIPFLGALIMSLVGILGLWPGVIDGI